MLWFLSLLQQLSLFISHVRTGFPEPLPAAEEKRLLEEYAATRSVSARNELVEHNLRLVAHIVKKYSAGDTDDLISIGTVGLIKAVMTYDGTKSTHLATYASRCIENEILMHLRTLKRRRGEVSLQSPLGTDKDGNELTLMDIIGAVEDESEHIDYRLGTGKLYSELRQLPQRERVVLALRYGLGGRKKMTQKQVAEALGISRSYISRIEKKAVETLEKRFRQ